MKNVFHNILLLGAVIMLGGCAGIVALPGGKDTINHSFYENDKDLKSRIVNLEEGMSTEDVFVALDRNPEDFIILTRQEIVSTLYGGEQMAATQAAHSSYDRKALQSLDGYKLLFKKVKRKHGVSSPIAMRTNETGYSYTATFIFKDGILYEKPILAGGVVDTTSTKTLFDYLSPGTFMGQAL